MKEEAQRIAIAEALGIEDVRWKLANGYLPDYLNDLNAIHEAEKVLTDEQHSLFRKLLFTGFYNRGEGITNEAAERARVSATAAQRAEAFLRTIGKWQDSPHP